MVEVGFRVISGGNRRGDGRCCSIGCICRRVKSREHHGIDLRIVFRMAYIVIQREKPAVRIVTLPVFDCDMMTFGAYRHGLRCRGAVSRKRAITPVLHIFTFRLLTTERTSSFFRSKLRSSGCISGHAPDLRNREAAMASVVPHCARRCVKSKRPSTGIPSRARSLR